MNFSITVKPNPAELGCAAAKKIVDSISEAITSRGTARIVLSTGSSQFDTFTALLALDVDWSKVEVFHLDEYIGLPESHPASFRKYLKERFAAHAKGLKAIHYVDGETDVQEHIAELTKAIRSAPIDVGVIGIGENAHIAFNDPPANFDTDEAFIVVELDEKCKRQQVGEGWFPSLDDVPKTAITMTVKQIMACKTIVSSVPHSVKANAVRQSLSEPVSAMTPASILKTHQNWHVFLDTNSASELFRI